MENTKFKLPAHPNKGAYEKQRLVELIRLGTMKSPEMRFQAIVDRVRAQYNVPYCMISFIDECKLMSQASHGFSFKEMDADQAICAYAMHEEDMFVVEDAATSDLLRDHPFVKGPPFIRFYAGIPIRSRGVPVGTLCLADVVTRTVSTIDRSLLKQFAADAEKAISEPDVIYQDIDFGDPGVRSEYLVYNKFLDESIKFFTTTHSTVVFIRLMPDSSASSPIPDSDLMLLSDNLNKYLHGINYRKGTFGHCNILLVIENSKFNGYGNAYLCGKALEFVFGIGGFKGISAMICYLQIKPFRPETIIQVNNIYKRIMTSVDMHPTSRVMYVSLGENYFDFSRLTTCFEQARDLGLQYESIRDLATGDRIIDKVKVPYEFHFADRGDMQLTETETDLLVNYNLLMFRKAFKRLAEAQCQVSVELSVSCVQSDMGKKELQKLLVHHKDIVSRLIISISGFSFAYHQTEMYRFIVTLKSMKVNIGFTTFSTMISHLPEFIVKEIDYGFIYTPIALDLQKYPDDEARLKILINEYKSLGITPVMMRGRQQDTSIIAAHGINLFESSLITS